MARLQKQRDLLGKAFALAPVQKTTTRRAPVDGVLTRVEGKVRRIQLLIDHKRWPPALEELAQRLWRKAS